MTEPGMGEGAEEKKHAAGQEKKRLQGSVGAPGLGVGLGGGIGRRVRARLAAGAPSLRRG